jgi:hypothetical protein
MWPGLRSSAVIPNSEIQQLGSDCVGVNSCPSANGRVDAKGAAPITVIVSVPKPRNRVGDDFVVVSLQL